MLKHKILWNYWQTDRRNAARHDGHTEAELEAFARHMARQRAAATA